MNEDEMEMKAIWKVVDYLDGEEKDYEEQGRPGGHIWESVQLLAAWLTEISGSLQALDSHRQAVVKRLRYVGVPIRKWPKRITVSDGNGRTGLIWSEGE